MNAIFEHLYVGSHSELDTHVQMNSFKTTFSICRWYINHCSNQTNNDKYQSLFIGRL